MPFKKIRRLERWLDAPGGGPKGIPKGVKLLFKVPRGIR